MPPPPPPQSRKPVIGTTLKLKFNLILILNFSPVNIHGSLKKRVAPMPPAGTIYGSVSTGGGQITAPTVMYGTLPSNHSRIPSDPAVGANYHTLSHTHKRSPSSDSNASRSVIHMGKYFSNS